jgi:hypothetical protein
VLNITEVTWKEVENQVKLINPEFALICSKVSSNKNYSLFKIKYPYGSKIVDKGVFNLPVVDSSKVVSLNDEQVSSYFKDKLNYSNIPLALILHNDNEVFIESADRIIPLNFFKAGDLFGVFEVVKMFAKISFNSLWNVSAGARSVFMLPKISDKISHNRIKQEYGINCEVPNSLMNQWDVFKEIIHKSGNSNIWYNELLVFGKDWFDEDKDYNINLLEFKNYIYETTWKQSAILINSIEFGLQWELFSATINRKSLKPRPYIIDSIKQLVSIANGSGIAFKPAIEETSLPVSFIQGIYMNIYKLKSYIPTIMQPDKLSSLNQKLYYSLSFPTTLETSPIMRNNRTLIQDEREIRLLINILLQTLNNKAYNRMIDKNITFKFYHYDDDKYSEIDDSNNIFIDDKNFSIYSNSSDTNVTRTFCANSVFLKGCIEIARN